MLRTGMLKKNKFSGVHLHWWSGIANSRTCRGVILNGTFIFIDFYLCDKLKERRWRNSNGIFFMLFTYLLKSACCIFKKAFRVLNIFSLFNSIFMNFTVHCTVFLCYVLLQIAEALMEALQAIDWLDEYIEGLSD